MVFWYIFVCLGWGDVKWEVFSAVFWLKNGRSSDFGEEIWTRWIRKRLDACPEVGEHEKIGQGDVFHCLIFWGVSHSDFFVKAFKNSRVALQLKASFLNSNLKNIKSQDLKLQNLQRFDLGTELPPRSLLLPLHHLQEVDMTIGSPCNLAEFTMQRWSSWLGFTSFTLRIPIL